MDVTNDIILNILATSGAFFSVYYSMYRKYIYSLIDPLFFFVVTTSFASVLATYVVPDAKDLFHFFCCQLFLWFGLAVPYRGYVSSFGKKKHIKIDCNFEQIQILQIVVFLCVLLFLASNTIIGYYKGFALLSSSPSSAKFENFQEGFGLFRKMNWALGTFSTIGLVYLYLMYRKKKYLFYMLFIALLSSLEGSKGALLQIIFASGTVLYHPKFSNEIDLLKKAKRYFPILILFAFSIVIIVLSKETENSSEVYLAFIRRLLYSSDSLIYFYTPTNVSFFEHYSIWEYLSRLLNPIFGFLRLQPYQEALGNVIYDNLRPPGIQPDTITVGPNAPFYLEGRIYFYYWFAFPYSFFVGLVYGKLRIRFFSLRRCTSFYFVLSASVCHFAQAVVIDTNLTVTQLFNLFFFIIPIFVFVSFLFNGKIAIRYRKMSKFADNNC